ncbi:poly(R)-hydroxyalkanoic acid synthase subunit PhaE [Marinobacterium sediminicola]|uniref:Poly(3-hydroxyalkanoate) polymerase subunit PhaE n=1 Tax=Marinobacterium sediminicola TaxID=518898 RepID=A0ABY1RVK4_9GAMM|nr:poly(R)-hydroxyalkanoic acid synthase subunit PhaE [Marinobacterium sediminicola]ULG70624.1 hypothetical protein LN244_07375 [Marinobacterium sediminicola]SMR68835.1 Poly(R)-hydroxyalkanoic acid synthase subunit (PHA_synth_III_E) [Marinobacterium sediminicola]
MNEQLLNMIGQWLEQFEQELNTPDSDQYSAGAEGQSPQGETSPHADLLHRITRQSEQFRHFASQLLSLCDDEHHIETDPLIDCFRKHLDQLNLEWILSSWPLPEQLTTVLAIFSQQNSTLNEELQHVNQLLQRLLGTLGPHLQPSLVQQLRTTLEDLRDFARSRQQYLEHLSRINSAALDLFSQRLQGTTISELEQLHRLWIQSYEECYQQALSQEEYRQAFAALCNNAMALRQHWQQQLDHFYSSCGLVTLAQYDELSRQHHELRRRVRVLEQQASHQRGSSSHFKDRHDSNQG